MDSLLEMIALQQCCLVIIVEIMDISDFSLIYRFTLMILINYLYFKASSLTEDFYFLL